MKVINTGITYLNESLYFRVFPFFLFSLILMIRYLFSYTGVFCCSQYTILCYTILLLRSLSCTIVNQGEMYYL